MKTNTLTKMSATIALSLVTSTLLHATNGDTLIAVGTKARGMGGVGIGMSHGAESTISNPAMITTVEGTEISFGGTLFMPSVSTTVNTVAGMPPQPKIDSAADMNMIPEVSLAHKINENWYIGVGMWGTAGMGVDYRGNQNLRTGQYGNLDMVTNLQLMQFAVPVAYKADGLSIAVAPILQYGNLDINYLMPSASTPGAANTIGAGLAQDFGFGWSAGASYDFKNGFVIGAVYKSSIEMTYDQQLSTATGPFAAMGIFPAPMDDVLEQPSEYGVGFSYNMGEHTLAFDWKRINWSGATGYKSFGWEDQDVYAVGYQFAQSNYALRIGYNYASSAVTAQSETGNGVASALNFFNLLGFPATAESHLTLGGTYDFSESFSLDLAYVHAFNSEKTFDTPAFSPFPPRGFGVASITTEHSEDSLSFQLTYKF